MLKNNPNIYKDVSLINQVLEIDNIKGSAVVWKEKGAWYGYDLFESQTKKKLFSRYKLMAGKSGKKADFPLLSKFLTANGILSEILKLEK